MCAILQAQSAEEVSALGLVDSVEDFHMVVGTAICGGLGELDDVSDLQIAELNALDGVAVAGLTIAQVGLVVGVAIALAAQNIHNTCLVMDTGRNIGAVPNAVFFSVREVIFVNGQRTLPGHIDGGVLYLCGKGGRDGGQAQDQCQEDGCDFLKRFHVQYPF